MTSNGKGAGLLGFLLALAAAGTPRADALPLAAAPAGGLEGRLARLTDAFRKNEGYLQVVPTNDPVYIGYAFLNNAPSFRNHTGGWLNRVSGWPNHGTFYNTGAKFLNNVPSFRNAFVGWPNHVSGWVNAGGFRNSGGFANGGGFRNAGGFANGGGAFRNGGGFYNR
jgi:rSAM-associated Gly-rich repeat protein